MQIVGVIWRVCPDDKVQSKDGAEFVEDEKGILLDMKRAVGIEHGHLSFQKTTDRHGSSLWPPAHERHWLLPPA